MGSRLGNIRVRIWHRWRICTRLAETVEGDEENTLHKDSSCHIDTEGFVEIDSTVGEATNYCIWEESHEVVYLPIQKIEEWRK